MLLDSLLNRIYDSMDQVAFSYPKEEKYLYSDILKRYEKYSKVISEFPGCRNARYLISVKDPFEYISIFLAVIKYGIAIPFEIAKDDYIATIIEECKANFIISQEELKVDRFSTDVIWDEEPIKILTIHDYQNETYKIDETIKMCYFTSGTTGKPKCVMFSEQALYNNINNLAELLNIGKDDVCYTPISPLMTGALNTIYLPALIKGANIAVNVTFLLGSVMKTINAKGVSVLFMVPLLYTRLLESNSVRKIAWEKIRICLTSSSYMGENTFKQFYEKTKICINSIYCSSECGVIAVNNSNQIEIAMKYVGHPLQGTEVKLMKDDRITESGESGEIIVAGINNSHGYLNFDNYILQVQVGDKIYYKTGDYGAITENGIVISGRISETVNIAGHLVDPIEIENILNNHEKILDSAVFSCIDDKDNEYIVAKIQCVKTETELDDIELKQYCRNYLAEYKIPSKFILVNEIERTANGKKIRRS